MILRAASVEQTTAYSLLAALRRLLASLKIQSLEYDWLPIQERIQAHVAFGEVCTSVN